LILHLAQELNAGWSGQRVVDLRFDRARRSSSIVCEERTLDWQLAQGPQVTAVRHEDQARSLVVLRKAHINRISALPDERVLRIEMTGGARDNAVATLMLELLPPLPTVIALDAEGRVLKVLLPHAARPQTRGQPYRPPVPLERSGIESPITLADWLDLLAAAAPAARANVLSAKLAYTSPINALPILGPAAREADASHLRDAYARYTELLTAPAGAFLLAAGNQPYGHSLWQQALACESLMAAFARAHTTTQDHQDARLEHALLRARRKRSRLEAEQEKAAQDAVRLREDADLLLAHAHAVRRGLTQVELTDFQGQTRRLQLDPALNAAANAQAWYAQARKRERAALRLPALIAQTSRRIDELQQALQHGSDDAHGAARLPEPQSRPGGRPTSAKLPYRRYRTSSGIEVRVGRSGRANDELTFHHAAPNDIWLHARDVGGAHVVMRWTDAHANPPRRDLEQAASLAALHSKARHSSVVAVDWTRRKHVHKPRRSAPGSVRIERVKTLFVRPDAGQLDVLS
jgi:predicted ribosome quality control (RQC) complex YloA/Tae2 family protein